MKLATFTTGDASELGVVVVNIPDLWIREVANHALGLLLAWNRRIITLDREVRRHAGRRTTVRGGCGAVRHRERLGVCSRVEELVGVVAGERQRLRRVVGGAHRCRAVRIVGIDAGLDAHTVGVLEPFGETRVEEAGRDGGRRTDGRHARARRQCQERHRREHQQEAGRERCASTDARPDRAVLSGAVPRHGPTPVNTENAHGVPPFLPAAPVATDSAPVPNRFLRSTAR